MKRKAFLAIVLGSLLAGMSGILIKNMQIPATSMAWVRMTIPTVVLGCWMWKNDISFFRGNMKLMLTASSMNTIRLYFFFIAYIYADLSNAVLVFYTWPIFATVFSYYLLKEDVTRRQVLILVIAFTGILLVYSSHEFSVDSTEFIGISAALASAFFYSLMVIIFKYESDHYQPGESVFYQNLVGSLVYLPFIIINEPRPNSLDWALSSTHGVVVGILVFYCFFFGLKHLKASTTSMITYLEIVSAVCVGVIFFDEVLSWNIMLGGALIIGSTSLLKTQNDDSLNNDTLSTTEGHT